MYRGTGKNVLIRVVHKFLYLLFFDWFIYFFDFLFIYYFYFLFTLSFLNFLYLLFLSSFSCNKFARFAEISEYSPGATMAQSAIPFIVEYKFWSVKNILYKYMIDKSVVGLLNWRSFQNGEVGFFQYKWIFRAACCLNVFFLFL